MKISRLLICIFLVLTLAIAISSCQGKATYYMVKFDSTGGSAVQNRAIESGKTFTAPDAPEKVGYTFIGWYNGETKWNFDTDTVNTDITLTAKWERVSHTVTFNSDGGTAIDSQTVYYGNLITEPSPEPTKQGSHFIGWYNGETKWNFSFDTVTDDITLTAKWEPMPTHTVTFNSDGGSAVAEQYIVEGTKASEPQMPTKAGYTLLGWYNGETKWNFDLDIINANVTLSAKWERIYHTVTFNSNGGSAVASIEVPEGEKIPKELTTSTHFRVFKGWYVGNTEGVEWDFETDVVTEPITLVAKWGEILTPTMPLG